VPARFFVVTLIAVAAATAVARTQVAIQDESAQAPPIFRAETDVVVVHANVFDNRSDAVPNLPQSAFQVLENDVAQEITFFSNADVPVAVGLIVDNSGSMIARRPMVVAGGTAFADSSHPDDELFTIHFNENIRFGLPQAFAFTNRRTLLEAALVRFPPGGKTALHDAVIAGLDHVEGATHQKHVLVVLSDGDDNASKYSEDDMIARARASDAIVYTVSNAVRGDGGASDAGLLRRLADVTGGVAYFPDSDREVVESFTEIAGNIRRAYSLGYVPTNDAKDGSYRRVRVVVRVPGRNLTVRTRHGYTASGHPGAR
jgi:Ca-activated chloride channel family protein